MFRDKSTCYYNYYNYYYYNNNYYCYNYYNSLVPVLQGPRCVQTVPDAPRQVDLTAV